MSKTYTESLRQLNRHLMESKGNQRELLEILKERNELIIINNKVGRRADIYEINNICEPLTSKTRISSYMVYHGSQKMQDYLFSDSISFKGLQKLDGVYFSTNVKNTMQYLDLSNPYSDKMVYTIDTRKVKDSRIQTNYDSQTLWDDMLRTFLDLHDKNKSSGTVEVPFEESTNEFKYTKKFAGKPLSELENAIIAELKEWKNKHTAEYDLLKRKEYEEKRWDFLIVKAPVAVLYES